MPNYEVFISRKHLDEAGRPTADVAIAEALHDHLTQLGVSTFLDDVALMQQGRARYKQAIDEALDQARVLIAVGTSRKHLDSEWVRYEWDGFFNDIISGIKPDGQVISLVQGMVPAELPRSLRQSQCFDVDQLGVERTAEFVFSALGRVPPAQPVPAVPPVPAAGKTGKHPTGIMFIDIVGSRKLYEELGREVADRIIGKAIRDWRKITRYNGGWPVKDVSDEILCAFETPDACVETAIEIREEQAIGLRGESVQIRLKIGLAFGELIRKDDGDVAGLRVYVAARMAGTAEADQIMVDGDTVALLSPSLRERCRYAGETTLKNSENVIKVYEVV